MKKRFALILAVVVQFMTTEFCAFPHPGSGIVVDDQGRVYFSEAGDIDAHLPGAIWQIDPQGKLTRLHEGGAHYLTLDVTRNFLQNKLDRWFGERLTPWLQRVDTSDGALIQADGQPIAMHRDGSLYYAKGNLEIFRLSIDGRLTPVAPTLDSGRFGGIKGLAFGPGDALYITCPGTILRLGTNGTVSTLIESIAVPDCDPDCPPNMPENQSPFLRGLALDTRGTVYAAATGCRAVLKITSNGKMTVAMRAERPWSPTGIAVRGEDVYAVEYQHPHSARREEWLPRVRKLGSSGEVTTLVTLRTAQGRPTTPER